MNESTDSTITAGARGRASNLKKRLKEDGRQKVESGKRAAADHIAEIADAIDVAGAQLDQSQPTLAGYASRLADGVSSLAVRLREDSVEDLYHEARRVAARHPAMFLLGSAAVGLALARFLKASGEEMSHHEMSDQRGDEFAADENLDAAAESQARQWGEATQDIQDEITSGREAPLYDQASAPGSYGAPPHTTERGV